MVKKQDNATGTTSDELGEFYGSVDIAGDTIDGDSGGSGGNSDGSGSDIGSGGGSGGGNIDPRGAFGSDGGDQPGDTDDRIIRDEFGNPTYSPTGRIRKRRAGGGDKSKSKPRGETKAKLSVSSVEALLLSTHNMLAAVTKVKELELSKPEGNMLAEGIVNVARHYPHTVIDPVYVDWFNLFMALGFVYAPRAQAVGEHIRAAKAQRVGSKAQEITPILTPSFDPNFPNG